MGTMMVSDVIIPDAPTPFLDFKSGSNLQSWEGVFAFNYHINKIDPDLAPTAVWPVENISMYVAGTTQNISMSQDGRWITGVTIRGRLCFQPRNRMIQTRWNEAGELISFGVSKHQLEHVAAQIYRGDPENIQLQGFGLFDDPMLTQIGWTLLNLLEDQRASTRLYAESLGVTLAHHLLHHYGPKASHSTTGLLTAVHQRQVQAAIDYIRVHYRQDLSLSEISMAANISVSHLTRLFRKATRYTPHQYLIRYRVELAYFLFQQRKHTGAEVAQLVGFYDESHLLRYFKRIYGTSPGKLFH